jgi:hypothetical protein
VGTHEPLLGAEEESQTSVVSSVGEEKQGWSHFKNFSKF